MVYRSVVVEEYLFETILALPSVTTTFADRIVTNRNEDDEGTEFPFLEIIRLPRSSTARPLVSGGPIIAEQFIYDISGWDESHTTDTILQAMNDIDNVLLNENEVFKDGFLIVVDQVEELPPAEPPRSGEDPIVRLGKAWSVAALGA